ncbi:MAG: DUF899 family protein [Candidatus Krumholzibacteria bacterium]|nr:DUF899 family protein [Candidatus Krumholzibacteria bacterium]
MNTEDLTAFDKELADAEKDLLERKKRLAELRKDRPQEDIKDYTLKNFGGEEVTLSSLFGHSDELLVIHNMGRSCPFCTLWADGFNGVVGHLSNRTPFVVVSPDDPKTQQEFYTSRGWTFPMLSASESEFVKDMGFMDAESNPSPGVSAFQKTPDGRIRRVAKTWFGPGDDFCSVWHLFDLLPHGAKNWEPRYKY